MAITATLIGVTPLGGGMVRLEQQFTDNFGWSSIRTAIVAAATNPTTDMAAYAAALPAIQAAAEIAANIMAVETVGSLAVPTFNYSTAAANAAVLRTAYASANSLQAVMIGDFLSSLTSAQLQSAFGLTAGQVTALQTSMLAPAAALAASIRAAAGQ